MPPDATPATTPLAPPAPGKATDVCAGAALGALLGLVMGLTTSPVASIVVTALVALLAAVFGLSDKAGLSFSGAAARRLAAFGIAAVIAIPTSIWMRVHEVLGVSVTEQRQMLQEIGIKDANEQKDLLRYLRFGAAPPSASASAGGGAYKPAPVAATGSPLLYSEPSSFCSEVASLRILHQPVADLDRLFVGSGEPQARLATAISTLPDAQRRTAYEAAADGLCAKK